MLEMGKKREKGKSPQTYMKVSNRAPLFSLPSCSAVPLYNSGSNATSLYALTSARQ